MNEIVAWISQPWPWYVAGPLIALVMFSLLLFGKNFGVSSNLRTMCSMAGAGKNCEFFAFEWFKQIWNLVFVGGMILGGFIAHEYLTPTGIAHISPATVAELQAMGLETAGSTMMPDELFSWSSLLTVRGIVMLVGGGFLIGFGARYAGGCTSGHAISGLSNLQLPSLIAVIGFFIGGLITAHYLLPILLTL